MKSHNAIITRHSPTAILFLIDLSGSMAEICNFGGERVTKSSAMNRIVNTTIQELVMRCKSFDCYYNYFDIAILGYQKGCVINLLKNITSRDSKFCSINELVNSDCDYRTYDYIQKRADGSDYVSQIKIREFIKSEPLGTTPMRTALEECHDTLQSWIWQHKGRNCFPPIAINITDGAATDSGSSELILAAQRIKRLATENGEVLLMNVHISSNENDVEISFPDSVDALPADKMVTTMFEMASHIPESFYEPLSKYYPNIKQSSLLNAKLMCYNAPVETLTKILEIGSISKSFIR